MHAVWPLDMAPLVGIFGLDSSDFLRRVKANQMNVLFQMRIAKASTSLDNSH